jgi:hypothetical protein
LKLAACGSRSLGLGASGFRRISGSWPDMTLAAAYGPKGNSESSRCF